MTTEVKAVQLLQEIHHWLSRSLPYQAPEVIDDVRRRYVEAIESLLNAPPPQRQSSPLNYCPSCSLAFADAPGAACRWQSFHHRGRRVI